MDYITSFDEDPERYALSIVLWLILLFFRFRAKVLNGSIKIYSTAYPLCLYDEELIDEEDPGLGFLRSKVLIAVSIQYHGANRSSLIQPSSSSIYSHRHPQPCKTNLNT
jgi:hypothetical protein